MYPPSIVYDMWCMIRTCPVYHHRIPVTALYEVYEGLGNGSWYSIRYRYRYNVPCYLVPSEYLYLVPGTTGRQRCLVPGPSMFYDEPMHVAMIGVLVPVV